MKISKIFHTYILPPLKPYKFSIEQLFIRFLIKMLFQVCKLRESPCTQYNSSRSEEPKQKIVYNFETINNPRLLGPFFMFRRLLQ